ncbi:MAG: tetratricopeptide repeat protein, partial [Nitrososphaeraceae archaeon]
MLNIFKNEFHSIYYFLIIFFSCISLLIFTEQLADAQIISLLTRDYDFIDTQNKPQFNDSKLYYSNGYSQIVNGNYSQAIESYDKAISLDPNWSAPWLDKGTVYFKLGNYSQAIESYDKAISLDPNWSAPWLDKGTVYFKLGNYSQAIESY